MHIGVDVRSIQRGTFSGVENYTMSLLERMIQQDRENVYTLFYNGLQPMQTDQLRFVNTRVVTGRFPNKALALTTLLLQRPDFAQYFSEADVVFMPNPNHMILSPGKRLVLTVHDISFLLTPEVYDLRRRVWHWSLCFSRLLKRADTIIAVSEYTKTDLVRVMGVNPDKIQVVPQGVDHSLFHANIAERELRACRNKYALPGEFVCFLGTIEPRKNVEFLIAAWERMEERLPLVIAGKPGWKYGRIFKRARQSSRSREIHFLDFVDERDKAALLSLARVFAFPSVYEGFGLPVLEAMAVGTLVVTSCVTSLPEVAGDAALLVNPYNQFELTAAMDQAVRDEGLRMQLRERGLMRAQEFTWDKTAKRTHDILIGKV